MNKQRLLNDTVVRSQIELGQNKRGRNSDGEVFSDVIFSVKETNGSFDLVICHVDGIQHLI